MALSIPKPISAMLLARIPAKIATVPSTVIHARLDHASSRAQRTSRSRSDEDSPGRSTAAGSALTSPPLRRRVPALTMGRLSATASAPRVERKSDVVDEIRGCQVNAYVKAGDPLALRVEDPDRRRVRVRVS